MQESTIPEPNEPGVEPALETTSLGRATPSHVKSPFGTLEDPPGEWDLDPADFAGFPSLEEPVRAALAVRERAVREARNDPDRAELLGHVAPALIALREMEKVAGVRLEAPEGEGGDLLRLAVRQPAMVELLRTTWACAAAPVVEVDTGTLTFGSPVATPVRSKLTDPVLLRLMPKVWLSADQMGEVGAGTDRSSAPLRGARVAAIWCCEGETVGWLLDAVRSDGFRRRMSVWGRRSRSHLEPLVGAALAASRR